MSKKKWSNEDNRRDALTTIANHLGYIKHEDWYKITRKDVINEGFYTLIKYYGQSPCQMVLDNFPEYDWKPWLFENLPRNFWLKKDNFVAYFQWLSGQLEIKKFEDWYKVDSGILKKYRYYKPLYESLREMYPEYDWKPWLFSGTPKRTWQDKNLHKKYFEWLSKELGIQKPEDWYQVTGESLKNFNAGGLITRYYKSDIYNFVMRHIPDYDWKPWLFQQVSSGYWRNKHNHKLYGGWLANVLKIDDKEKWYFVSQKDFVRYGGASLLSMYYKGSPASFVLENFPDLHLDVTKFKNNRKEQSKLYFIVKKIFPELEVLWEKKHDQIRSKHNRKLELDVFVPEIKLAFEMQGKQHYEKCSGFFKNTFHKMKENDEIKRRRCLELGIKLIEIPYTWDQTQEFVEKML